MHQSRPAFRLEDAPQDGPQRNEMPRASGAAHFEQACAAEGSHAVDLLNWIINSAPIVGCPAGMAHTIHAVK